VSRAERKSGAGWYVVAVSLALSGFIAGAAMAWHAIGLIADSTQFLAPGRVVIEVAKPGDYLIWHNYRAVFQGRTYAAEKSLPDGVVFRVVGPNGEVAVAGANGATSTMGETVSVAVASFPAKTAGHYEIAVEGQFPARVFSVGPDNLARVFAYIFGGVVTVMLAFAAGIGLGVWAYLKGKKQLVSTGEGSVAMGTAEVDTDHAKKQLVTLVYALQAASFLVGITFIAAIIVNYAKRDELAGSWLESHFNWQIRTFWWSLLWAVIGLVLSVVLIGFFILIADAIWVLYRIVIGWLALNDGNEMYE
jgi:uncharacterized membrane protein